MSTNRVRFLHVANGTCTTQIIESAGVPGACSIWADPLYEGPVPAGLGDGELLEVRRQYLAGPGDLTGAAWAGPIPPSIRQMTCGSGARRLNATSRTAN
jgi:hypothetical protein